VFPDKPTVQKNRVIRSTPHVSSVSSPRVYCNPDRFPFAVTVTVT